MRGLVAVEEGRPVGPGVGEGHRRLGPSTSARVSPDGFGLWLLRTQLAAGSAIEWDGTGGEQGVHVVAGELELDGRRCPEGGALVVEHGARGRAVALVDAEVVHEGRSPTTEAAGPGPGDRPGRIGRAPEIHVVGPGGTYARVEPGRSTVFFADSTCDGCALTLFLTGRDAPYESAPHSHSADELIHVLAGELVLGRRVLGPGATLAVEADRRYGFRSSGFRFLNYRPGPSTLTRAADGATVAEGGRASGFTPVMDLR